MVSHKNDRLDSIGENMFDRLYEILKPKRDTKVEENYESVEDLPISEEPHQDEDASNPDLKGE